LVKKGSGEAPQRIDLNSLFFSLQKTDDREDADEPRIHYAPSDERRGSGAKLAGDIEHVPAGALTRRIRRSWSTTGDS
jgi:hypothetical protein